jgi:integrase
MALSVFGIKNAAPRDKAYRLADGHGLHLLIQPNGNKLWRLRYRFGGVEKMLALGSFPATPLADARARRDEARKLLEAGVDPSAQRKLDRASAVAATKNTFRAVAAEHIQDMIDSKAAEATIGKKRWLLEDLAAPLADRPIADITPAELLDLLKRIEKSGRRETARRLRGALGAVFRLAVVTLRAPGDPTFALRGALSRPNVTHRAAITEEKKLGALMRAIDDFDGWPTIKAALTFTALTCARPGEVRGARRAEIDFEKAVWRIPAERMKMRRSHDVPLSRQAVAVLEEVWPLSASAELVFPSLITFTKPISENAMNLALRRMGFDHDEMTSHGFRSSASTILNERGVRADIIEAMLGHQDKNAIRRTYNRATYWAERTELMQQWADLLDEFRRL